MDVINSTDFLKQYLGGFPEKERCSTKSPSGHCPDPAFYAVHTDDRPTEFYCIRCTSAVIFHATTRGRAITIHRVEESDGRHDHKLRV